MGRRPKNTRKTIGYKNKNFENDLIVEDYSNTENHNNLILN
jgi:hypothetical protein